eukprot:TRINITY_DN5880_c0_g1_i1.p1 TRINITY_DN5880_c0_g1~~TRINITY_DN5880_c0_g1_i1.p1  ORF type:complete len:280 (+),score=62.11 TRINITY_DN5880_c0_g1_i1:23-862(+)
MAAVREVLADSFSFSLEQWFHPHFEHPFLNLHTIVVPNDLKPIPPKWVNEVELDEFGAEVADVVGEVPVLFWTAEERKMRLQMALKRLDLQDLLTGASEEQNKKVASMSATQLNQEKKRVKNELKKYDTDYRKQFKVLPNHSQKEAMRPLYMYYRRLKQQIKLSSAGRPSGNPGEVDSDDEDRQPDNIKVLSSRSNLHGDVEQQIAQLEARVNALQKEKGSVRTKLREFQESFALQHQRKIKFHKDILPIEREYRMYKNVKEEIARAESQIRSLRVGPM